MIRLNCDNWNETDNLKSFLLFAQLIEEMLNHHTIDSYRAPVLNTHSLFDEFVDVNNEISTGYLKPISLLPIKDELLDSIENDNVAKKILEGHITHIEDTLKNLKVKTNPDKNKINAENNTEYRYAPHIKSIEIAKQILDRHYFAQLKSDLLDLITNNPNEKEKITLLTRSFVTELLYIGYSEEYIYHVTKNFFFGKKRITSPTQMSKFFSQFPETKSNWTVVFKGATEFDNIKHSRVMQNFKIKVRKTRVGIGKKRKIKEENLFLSKKTVDFPLFLICEEVSAFDPYSAKRQSEDFLRFINSLANHNNHKILLGIEKPILFNETLTYKENKFFMRTKPTIEPIEKILDNSEDFEQDLNRLTNVFIKMNSSDSSASSFYNLMYSVNSHHCALKSNTSDHQLLCLWTAIETLLPPNNNDSLIENFVSSISPFLGREYIQKLIEDLRRSIKEQLTEAAYIDFISQFPSEYNETEKIALCISLTEYDHSLQELCDTLGKNSLLPNRIYQLTKKLRKAKDIEKTLRIHNERVKLQLKRIYRVRNLITHKGKPTEYVPRLVENTHFYYHIIINSVIKKCYNSNYPISSLEDIFALIKFEHESHIKYLTENSTLECNRSNFRNLLFGYP